MKNQALNFTVLVCITLMVLQTVFMIIPFNAILLYNMALRPLVYAALAVIVYVFIGLDERQVRKAHNSNTVAIVSLATFGVVIIIAAFLFGAGANVMAPNLSVVGHSLWERGSIIILGELIRYKLIKKAGQENRTGIVVALTIVLAFGQMNAVRMMIQGDMAVWTVFFESVFRPLAISAVASYLAVEGSFLSVILLSFAYSMAPYLVPILPNISPTAWSLIISGLAFLTGVILYFATNEKGCSQRVREKQVLKYYAKKPIFYNAITAVVIIAIITFFAGVFPIYPVVVLTGSMAGTFERGSLVFVERVPPGDAFIRVGEGYVIHFVNHNGVSYIHRVIDFGHNIDGERQYVTRGDATELVDPFAVTQDDVLGIARASLPFFGYPYIFFQAVRGAFN